MKPPLPNNESARLEELRRYQVLDTAPEDAFDDLTTLAANICKAPIALISLIDENRQWFKSRVGLDATETSRDIAFCAHAILQPDLFIVEDALADERFASNPLVKAEPKIRFYAGAPLITRHGYALGTLCVVDRVPRELSNEHKQALRVLRNHVVTQLELRRALGELKRANLERDRALKALERTQEELEEQLQQRTRALEEANESLKEKESRLSGKFAELEQVYRTAPVGLALMDRDLRHVRINDRLAAINGRPATEHIGRTLHEIIPELADQVTGLYRRVLATGEPVLDVEIHGVTPAEPGAERDWLASYYPLKLEDGSIGGISAIVVDITERKRAETERQQLLAAERAARIEAEAAQDRLVGILERITDGFVALDTNWRYTYVNHNAGELLGKPAEYLIGKHIWTEFPEGIGQPFYNAYYEAAATQEPVQIEEFYQPWGRWFENRIYPSPDGLSIYFHEITERKQHEKLMAGQKQILEMVASGVPLAEVLKALATFVETQSGRAVCSVRLLEPDQHRLRSVAAPSLSPDYIRAIDEVELGPSGGSCSEAILRNQIAIVSDIAGDPVWERVRELALGHGLRACTSAPIKGSKNEVLGTVALYYAVATTPSFDDRRVLDAATALAAIAIEHNRSVEALRESEQRYRTLVETCPDPILVASEGRLTYANEAAAQMFGVESSDWFLGRSTLELVHPDEHAATIERGLRILEFGSAPLAERKFVRPDGTAVHTEIASARVVDRRGPAILSVIRDVSDRKRAEETLRQSEKKFSTIFQTTPDPVTITRLSDGVILDVNDAFCERSGYTREEALGRRTLELGIFADAAEREQVIGALRGVGVVRNAEVSYRVRDGSLMNGLLSAQIVDIDGEQCILGISKDISEMKRVEEALRESSQFNQQIIAGAREGIVVYGPDLRYQVWNPFMETLSGVPASEVIGKHPLEAFPFLEAEGIFALIQRALAGESVSTGDRPFRLAPTGKKGWVSSTLGPLRKASGEIIGVISMVHDITARRKAEQALQESTEQLRALSAHLQTVREEERTRIAREIHDELGQALTGLKMDLNWLDRRLLDTAGRDYPDVLEKARSMASMVEATISTVRRIATDLRPGVLDDLGVVAAIEWQAHDFQKRSGIRCRFQSNVEDIDLDPGRSTALFRIFQETLTNIARHAEATAVNIKLTRKDAELILEVRDNGRGISAGELSGTGSLGLLGMRERAHSLGGEVQIEGRQGKGTTVIARIPLG